MVCRNGGGTQKIWKYKDLCGFEATELIMGLFCSMVNAKVSLIIS